MIIPARQAFLESPHKDAHGKIVMTEAFQAAVRAAMLAFVEEQPTAKDPSAGWDAHSQVIGARRVLEILCTLHEKPEPIKHLTTPQLREVPYARNR